MDEKPFETLNVIPFVDIMLVLLTIVLTTANFIATGRIPVALPQASQAPVEQIRNQTIALTVDGGIYLNDQRVTADELEQKAKALPPDTAFLIRADKDLPLQKFIDVADLLKRLSFTKVAVQTRSISR